MQLLAIQLCFHVWGTANQTILETVVVYTALQNRQYVIISHTHLSVYRHHTIIFYYTVPTTEHKSFRTPRVIIYAVPTTHYTNLIVYYYVFNNIPIYYYQAYFECVKIVWRAVCYSCNIPIVNEQTPCFLIVIAITVRTYVFLSILTDHVGKRNSISIRPGPRPKHSRLMYSHIKI